MSYPNLFTKPKLTKSCPAITQVNLLKMNIVHIPVKKHTDMLRCAKDRLGLKAKEMYCMPYESDKVHAQQTGTTMPGPAIQISNSTTSTSMILSILDKAPG
jgi:hypothetical protein